jgi:hypothetical protein
VRRDVVAQVGFERHILKPGLIFKGKGLKPGAFTLWVNRVQRAPPHRQQGLDAGQEVAPSGLSGTQPPRLRLLSAEVHLLQLLVEVQVRAAHDVAVQVEFENPKFETGFSRLIG